MTRDYWTEASKKMPHKIVEFTGRKDKDGKTVRIAMQVLSQYDATVISIDLEKSVRKYFKDSEIELPKIGEASEGYVRVTEQEAAIKTLFKVCRNPDDLKQPFFKNPIVMSQELTTEEVGFLMTLYHRVRSECSPMRYDISEIECDAIIDNIHESQSTYVLEGMSKSVIADFIMHAVNKLKTSKQ